MASFGEAQESMLPPCLRNKNLYLGLSWNSLIVRVELKGQLEFLGNKQPVIIKNPVIGQWDIHKDDGLPIGMKILVKNSKVYAIGGSNHSDGKPCKGLAKDCLSQPVSMLVYEFDTLGDDGGRPSFRHCSSVSQLPVPQLPVGMNGAYIVKHMGKTYVLYGKHMLNPGLSPENKTLVLEKSFLVLEKDGIGWKSLPCLPFLRDEYRALWAHFHGAIGTKLYVSAKQQMLAYDINKKQWENASNLTWRMVEGGAITLSSLSTTITNELEKPSYVVIYALCDYNSTWHSICAALVDEDGIITRSQDILEATGKYDAVDYWKLIELSFKRESSTFALVFIQGDKVFGLTVVEVSLIPGFSQGDAFLKEKVLLNQRYVMEDKVMCDLSIIEDAFFC